MWSLQLVMSSVALNRLQKILSLLNETKGKPDDSDNYDIQKDDYENGGRRDAGLSGMSMKKNGEVYERYR